MEIHLNHRSLPDEAAKVYRAAFPSYTGHKFSVRFSDSISVNNMWSGGSRDHTRFVRLADFAALEPADTWNVGAQEAPLPAGLVAVVHTIFCGDDLGLTIVAPAHAAHLFPMPEVDLTRDEKIVLDATRSYKSSYGGVSDYRFREAASYTKITRERWDAAKASCIAKRLLNKAGAITPEGKNAVGDFRCDHIEVAR